MSNASWVQTSVDEARPSEAADNGLDTCSGCGQSVSAKAPTCPHCGHPINPYKSSATMVLVFGILAIVLPIYGIVFGGLALGFGIREVRQIEAGLRMASGRTKARVGRALGVIGIAVWVLLLVVFVVATPDTDPDAVRSESQLAEVLTQVTAELQIPSSWEVEAQYVELGGLGYRASRDLANSGTWTLISVTPIESLDEPLDRDEFVQAWIDRAVVDKGGRVTAEPEETIKSGVEGFLFEVEGLKGRKTGQDLGAYVALFFGTEYHYQVIAQYESDDSDQMSTVWSTMLVNLTLTDGAHTPPSKPESSTIPTPTRPSS